MYGLYSKRRAFKMINSSNKIRKLMAKERTQFLMEQYCTFKRFKNFVSNKNDRTHIFCDVEPLFQSFALRVCRIFEYVCVCVYVFSLLFCCYWCCWRCCRCCCFCCLLLSLSHNSQPLGHLK